MIPLTYDENKLYEKQKVSYICKKEFSTVDDNKKHHKVRVNTQENIQELLMIFVI